MSWALRDVSGTERAGSTDPLGVYRLEGMVNVDLNPHVGLKGNTKADWKILSTPHNNFKKDATFISRPSKWLEWLPLPIYPMQMTIPWWGNSLPLRMRILPARAVQLPESPGFAVPLRLARLAGLQWLHHWTQWRDECHGLPTWGVPLGTPWLWHRQGRMECSWDGVPHSDHSAIVERKGEVSEAWWSYHSEVGWNPFERSKYS